MHLNKQVLVLQRGSLYRSGAFMETTTDSSVVSCDPLQSDANVGMFEEPNNKAREPKKYTHTVAESLGL